MLPELLLAVAVLIVSLIAVLGAYHSALHLTEVSRQAAVALNDLKDMMERIKETPFNAIATNFPNGVVGGPGGNPYNTIVGGYTLGQEQVTVTYPNPGTDPLEVTVTLNWTNQNRTHTRRLSTIRAS